MLGSPLLQILNVHVDYIPLPLSDLMCLFFIVNFNGHGGKSVMYICDDSSRARKYIIPLYRIQTTVAYAWGMSGHLRKAKKASEHMVMTRKWFI